MAGNARFDSNSASPEDLAYAVNYPDGQRGNYLNAGLDRYGSFRESTESRMFNSGASTSRGSASSSGDMPPITQCLTMDPISLGDQKYTQLGEVRRVLGISHGNTSEENSFGAAQTKFLPPVATEELKRFKASVLDASVKARGRAKRLNESLQKLNKYSEALNSKKQQRNDSFTSERSGGLNILKMGVQSHRNPSDLGSPRLEDRTKSLVLQKRVRSSIAELRADGRSQTIARQPLVMGKDREMLRDGGEGSDVVEEKIRRLPTGGEGWDKKMRRKRSVGTASTRPTDGNGESKRIMHYKLNSEPGLQSSDAQGFRSGSFNGTAVVGKIDDTFFPAGSSMHATPKNDAERVSSSKDLTRGLNKDRLVAKSNNKSSVLEDNHIISPGQVTKGKASRAPRTGPIIASCSSPNFPRVSGALDGCELPSSVNKVNPVGGANNRKRPAPTGSASPSMAQWVGQRPQKISRTRRANLVPPVTNQDELQLQSKGCSPCDNGSRVPTVGTNGLLLARAAVSGTQQIRVKLENLSSPARLSESEESGAGENRESRGKERGTVGGEVEENALDQNAGTSLLLPKKNKILSKEEIGDGVRRQGRSSRGSSITRANISPMRDKLESPKPPKSTRTGSDKNGSKSGRPPLKKLSDRKASTHLAHVPNGASPDFTGESDDDHEELLAAANFACNASYLACSGSFWKKMEPVFARFSLEDTCSLKQQLESMEELHKGISPMFDQSNVNSGDLVKAEHFQSHLAPEETERSVQDQILLERGQKFPPLFQRVLSALIVENEFDDFEEKNGGRNILFQCGGEDSLGGTCLPMDVEPRNGNRIDFEYEPLLDVKSQKHSSVDRFSDNGNPLNIRSTSMHNQLCSDGLFQESNGFMESKIGILPEFSEVHGGEHPSLHANGSVISSLDLPYEQMCLEDKLILELRSIGIFPETVPDLADGEDEAINQDIIELQKELHEQVGKKKTYLNSIRKSIEESMKAERRDLVQIAMDRLVELSYKKLLATRGSFASKYEVPKVSKQVALVFMKRTLARCHRFEDTNKSCFSEPALQDIIFAAPPRANDAESMSCFGFSVSANKKPEDSQVQQGNSGSSDAFCAPVYSCDQEFAKTGPILNRGKKKELFLDDVGGSASFRAPSLGNTILGGAKGKRSEWERDKDKLGKNSVTKAGRTSVNNVKVERKTKSKPKQKSAQLSTAGNGIVSKYTETTHPAYSLAGDSCEKLTNDNSRKREVRMMSHGNNGQDSSKDVRGPVDITNLNELDPIEELGVADEFGGHQDLSNWFNFEEDGLQDHDSVGLDIPMDDLSELNMLL
ncbi:uncharacterized protein LOC120005165 isoform X2 [Tripterygium wilfordii]|uniref:uncharacterized protein LOC120005165 isoform X2 n=1 Tax=Tripterygium wilfordii TaxID=458696 RepID=UPI0018F828A9|nr:uncharacterized protein LOC120005165 isoform X2 [Tripterygium wilfordii]